MIKAMITRVVMVISRILNIRGLPLRSPGAFKVDEAVIRVGLEQAHAYLLANNKPALAP